MAQDRLYGFTQGELVRTPSAHIGRVIGPTSGDGRVLVEVDRGTNRGMQLACLPELLTRVNPTAATPTLDLTPDGLRIITPTPDGPVVAWLEPHEAVAAARAIRDRWEAGPNEGDERVEDQGRRGVL